MSAKPTVKFNLTGTEKARLRSHRLKIADVIEMSKEDIILVMGVSQSRAQELYGLAEFQKLPSIGVKFAQDLVSMGYYELNQLKDKDGARLVEEFERQKGYWIDPCVEDQFRLVVHYANHPGDHRSWWDFTSIRKAYRAEYGYAEDRPSTPWHEAVEIKKGTAKSQ